jgi:xanthine permease XanP
LCSARREPDQPEQVTGASLFSLPSFKHLSWAFDATLVLPFLIATIGSTLKNVGDVTTCQRVNDAAWTRPDINSIQGGIAADAATTVVAGAIGGMGQASYSANVGLSMATAATSRVIAYSAGGLFILLALFPKLAAMFAIMPKPVMSAGLVFAVSFMIVAGLQIIMSRMLDSRKILVVGISVIFGIGAPILEQSFLSAPPWIKPLLASPLSVATITVIVLNAILRIGVGKRAQIDLPRESGVSEKAADFLLASGSAWGARRDVVQRATAALGELVESIFAAESSEGGISVTADFDEFNLDLLLRYQGEPLVFAGIRPDPMELLEDESAFTKLSSFLVSRYADRIETKNEGRQCRVRLHFDH